MILNPIVPSDVLVAYLEEPNEGAARRRIKRLVEGIEAEEVDQQDGEGGW